MENQAPPNPGTQSDEIDLGQLFKIIGKAFDRLGRAFLRLFLYFKRKIVILIVLFVAGAAIGFGLNQIVTKKLKTEVIVKPNLESKNYLYDVVQEIQSNMKAGDTAFFRTIGVDVDQLQGFDVIIEPLEGKNEYQDVENDLKYLELLEKFQNDEIVADVVRSEIMNRSTLVHRITFFYLKDSQGNDIARKLMAYINSNDYFSDMMKISRENAVERITQNNNLVSQIDQLVVNYSEKLGSRAESTQGQIVVGQEDQLDIPGLLTLKNSLIRDIERKKLEMQGPAVAIRIINFGSPQVVQKSFFTKNVVWIPLVLLILFFLWDFFKYLSRKAREMQSH